jgi:adenine-specific DNA-methyltransferase
MTKHKVVLVPFPFDDLYSTTGRPLARPATGKIAIKVSNHIGDEVLKVFDV